MNPRRLGAWAGLEVATRAGHLATPPARLLPGLVGLAVVVVSPSTLYAVDACTFVASALLLRAIRRALTGRRETPSRLREDVLTGLRWLRGHRTVASITAVGTLASFTMGALVGQLVPFADQQLGIRQGDWRLGAVYSAFAVGGLAGASSFRLLRRWNAAPAQKCLPSEPSTMARQRGSASSCS